MLVARKPPSGVGPRAILLFAEPDGRIEATSNFSGSFDCAPSESVRPREAKAPARIAFLVRARPVMFIEIPYLVYGRTELSLGGAGLFRLSLFQVLGQDDVAGRRRVKRRQQLEALAQVAAGHLARA